jgi:hypothetical protein
VSIPSSWFFAQATEQAGFVLGIKAGGPDCLSQETDNQGGFVQTLKAGWAAALEVPVESRRVFLAERPEQVEFVEIL